MTHDELLERISLAIPKDNSNVYIEDAVTALRAVVELHKPWFPIGIPKCGKCNVPYPCEDIQAVEKGLK